MTMSKLFAPYKLGNITLSNRVAMAPLTRNRAQHGQVPSLLAVDYYRQRASAGLIITEGTAVSQQGQGYQDVPGIYTREQIAGWKKITEAVHADGGHIFMQLWHVGRISHTSLQLNGGPPVGPSAIRANAKTFVNNAFTDVSEPRALELAEIQGVIDSFGQAAVNAMEAGFDGVEIHGANGYLLDQFTRSSVNNRADAYGGTLENRARLILEVANAVAGKIGGHRTGIRISPVTPANGAAIDEDAQELFGFIVDALSAEGLIYLHVVEGATGGARDNVPFDYVSLRRRFRGTYVANNGFDLELAEKVLAADAADLVAFGKPFISNPDLVERLRTGATLNDADRSTFYGGGAKGYTDYPALAANK